MRRLALWFHARSVATRLLVGSLATAIPFYFAALLSYMVSDVAKKGGVTPLAAHAAVFIVLFTATVFIARYLTAVAQDLRREADARAKLLLHAYAYVDRLASDELATLQSDAPDTETFIPQLVASRERLQGVVAAAYATFEAAFGTATASANRTDFEVTFMTKSYRDGHITIPAAANREGRSPRSMVLREKDPTIYDRSVTARIYREVRPSIHIIEDTSRPAYDYQELYSGERSRIRSSIVYPVLSDRNILLGTLVVHCDQAGFFKEAEEKHWTDVLEVFSKRLALVKARLDVLYAISGTEGCSLSVYIPTAPF